MTYEHSLQPGVCSYIFSLLPVFRRAMLRMIYLVLAVAPVAIAQSAVTEANCTDSRFNWVSVNHISLLLEWLIAQPIIGI